MKLNLDFTGATLLKNWWKTVKENFKAIQTRFNSHAEAAVLDHPDKSVTTEKIADRAVTELKIADSAVSADKLMDISVVTSKIADGAVTGAKLAEDIINQLDGFQKHIDNPSQEIADGAVTKSKLADEAVSEEKLSSAVREKLNRDDKYNPYKMSVYQNFAGINTYETFYIYNDTEESSSYIMAHDEYGWRICEENNDGVEVEHIIEPNTIAQVYIYQKFVSGAEPSDGKLMFVRNIDKFDGEMIADNSVTESKIGNGAVKESKIADGAVTEEKLADEVKEKLDGMEQYTFGNGLWVEDSTNIVGISTIDPIQTNSDGDLCLGFTDPFNVTPGGDLYLMTDETLGYGSDGYSLGIADGAITEEKLGDDVKTKLVDLEARLAALEG